MLSLAVFAGLFLSFLVVLAFALAWAARLVRSPRPRFKVGLAAAGGLVAANVIGFALASRLPPMRTGAEASGVAVAMFVAQVGVSLLILRAAFRITAKRALLPLVAQVAVGFGYATLMAAVVQPRLTETFVTPTESMVPTLVVGDRVSVDKRATPRRWDLVAYRSNAPGEPIVLCKRLVGLPGERLRFEAGKVYVDDQPIDVPPVVAGRYVASPGGGMPGRYRDGETIRLGDAEYFFVGDNVDRSVDSRIEGPTDRSKLVGVADLRFWPIGRMAFLR